MRFFLVLVCLTASLWSNPTMSHAGPFGRMRDSQMQGQVMQKMQEALDLTDAQKKQIEPIVNRSMEQFKELRNLQGPEKKTKRSTWCAAHWPRSARSSRQLSARRSPICSTC